MENNELKEQLDYFSQNLFKVYKVQRFIFLETALILASSILILIFESPYDISKIKTFGISIWWSLITVTSGGFGDMPPQSLIGKFIGVTLAFSGVILLGIIIAMFALYFGRKRDDFYSKRNYKYLENITKELEKLRKEVEFLVKKK